MRLRGRVATRVSIGKSTFKHLLECCIIFAFHWHFTWVLSTPEGHILGVVTVVDPHLIVPAVSQARLMALTPHPVQ
mgnify:CR=1 FL=1